MILLEQYRPYEWYRMSERTTQLTMFHVVLVLDPLNHPRATACAIKDNKIQQKAEEKRATHGSCMCAFFTYKNTTNIHLVMQLVSPSSLKSHHSKNKVTFRQK